MDKVTICIWNANGLKNKIGELIEFLDRFQIDIAMINETKCMTKDKLKIKNYTCIRKKRKNSAGGLALFIRNSIPHKAYICIIRMCLYKVS